MYEDIQKGYGVYLPNFFVGGIWYFLECLGLSYINHSSWGEEISKAGRVGWGAIACFCRPERLRKF